MNTPQRKRRPGRPRRSSAVERGSASYGHRDRCEQQVGVRKRWAWRRDARACAFWTGPKAGPAVAIVSITVITVSAGRGRLDRVQHPGERRVLTRVLSHERTQRRRHREDELRPVVPVGSDVECRILRSQQRNIFALVEPMGGLEGVTYQFGHRENTRPGCRIFRRLHTFVEVLAELWVIDETGDNAIP